ncbi:MAG: hypothetical protein DRP96_11610 [Candidatus Neomarinimicrobiota bacterium]|nr:MAG: hypothetical protein DRP96_11610 [Candidatus Neomarinimicrobiota bacterium]
MNSKNSILTFCCIIGFILTSGNILASYSHITLLNNGGEWAWNQGGMYFGRSSYLGDGTLVRTYRTDDLSGAIQTMPKLIQSEYLLQSLMNLEPVM